MTQHTTALTMISVWWLSLGFENGAASAMSVCAVLSSPRPSWSKFSQQSVSNIARGTKAVVVVVVVKRVEVEKSMSPGWNLGWDLTWDGVSLK